jgi:hypothetical protein
VRSLLCPCLGNSYIRLRLLAVQMTTKGPPRTAPRSLIACDHEE